MNICTVKVVKVTRHPNAQKLRVCQVNDSRQNIQVVCGAANVREGMITLLAKVGSKLPSGRDIQQAQLRGVQSDGMLCSAKDLSIAEEPGVVDLPPETVLNIEYTQLDQNLLSSTPWHQFELVDTHWLAGNKILVKMGSEQTRSLEKDMKMISQTYYDGKKYLYRNY